MKALPLLLCLALPGCCTVKLDNARRLIERPDFPAVKQAAPEWAADALKTINALEYDQERR